MRHVGTARDCVRQEAPGAAAGLERASPSGRTKLSRDDPPSSTIAPFRKDVATDFMDSECCILRSALCIFLSEAQVLPSGLAALKSFAVAPEHPKPRLASSFDAAERQKGRHRQNLPNAPIRSYPVTPSQTIFLDFDRLNHELPSAPLLAAMAPGSPKSSRGSRQSADQNDRFSAPHPACFATFARFRGKSIEVPLHEPFISPGEFCQSRSIKASQGVFQSAFRAPPRSTTPSLHHSTTPLSLSCLTFASPSRSDLITCECNVTWLSREKRSAGPLAWSGTGFRLQNPPAAREIAGQQLGQRIAGILPSLRAIRAGGGRCPGNALSARVIDPATPAVSPRRIPGLPAKAFQKLAPPALLAGAIFLLAFGGFC